MLVVEYAISTLLDSRLLGVVWLVALCTDPALAVFDMDLFEMLGSKVRQLNPNPIFESGGGGGDYITPENQKN